MKTIKSVIFVQRRVFGASNVNGFVKRYSTGNFSFMSLLLKNEFHKIYHEITVTTGDLCNVLMFQGQTFIVLNGCDK